MVLHTFLTKMLRKGNVLFVTKSLETIRCIQVELSNHLLKIHPKYKDKGIAFFKRKRDALKRAKLDSSGTYYKENISLVEAFL